MSTVAQSDTSPGRAGIDKGMSKRMPRSRRNTVLSAIIAGLGLAYSYVPNIFIAEPKLWKQIQSLPYYSPLVILWSAIVIPVVIIALLTWLYRREHSSDEEPPTAVPKEFRAQLLNRVSNDIREFLQSSLYSVARIELRHPEAQGEVDSHTGTYASWIRLKATEDGDENGDLDPTLPIIEVFRRSAHLLILGEPGSGKTTLLNELAHELIRIAQQGENEPVPVIVPLADWSPGAASFEEWLIPALKRSWSIDARHSRGMLQFVQVVLLLDALDEVAEAQRENCVRAINNFRERNGLLAVVVSCRLNEYQRSAPRLRLSRAVRILPLEEHEVRNYLMENVIATPGLLDRYVGDLIIRGLLRTPLWLNVARLAFRDPRHILPPTSEKELRSVLLDRYVDYMFSRSIYSDIAGEERHAKTILPPHSRQQTTHCLKWLASSMIRLSRDRFYLEDLSEDWFPSGPRNRMYWRWKLVMGLAFVLPIGLVVALFVGPFVGLVVGLFFGLLFVLLGGLFVGLPAYRNSAATLSWSWRRARSGLVFASVYGLAVGLAVGLAAGLFLGFEVGSVFGSTFGTVFGLNYLIHMSLEGGRIRELPKPNEGTWRSANYGLFVALCAALLLAVPFALRNFAANSRLATIPVWALGATLGIFAWHMVSLGLTKGGGFWFAHWNFRLSLRSYGHAPLRLDRFLEYAAHRRLFLQRIGGGYRFVHDVVREHFASLDA